MVDVVCALFYTCAIVTFYWTYIYEHILLFVGQQQQKITSKVKNITFEEEKKLVISIRYGGE